MKILSRYSEKYRSEASLLRPVINWKRAFFTMMTAAAIAFAVAAAVCRYLDRAGCYEQVNAALDFLKYIYLLPIKALELKLGLLLLTAMGMAWSRRIIVFLVRVYQCYAPDSVRLACRFKPSCSEYMILAVEKYGTIRGVCKGIGRLSRCCYPNGGEDYP